MSFHLRKMTENVVSGVLRTANRIIRRRNSLKTLQLSADDQEVVRPNMVYPKDKSTSKTKQSNAVEKLASEKENVPSVRRSKRKVAASDLKNYAESPDDPKPSKPAPKPKIATKPKTKAAAKSKKGHSNAVKKADSNQTKLKFPPVTPEEKSKADSVEPAAPVKIATEASISTLTEDSGYDPNNEVREENSSCLNETKLQFTVCTPTADKDTSLITSATPTAQYWKELAEQRRIALEIALRDNELIYDQLIVLEAENSQLKQLVREAENLASIVKSIVE